LKEAEMNETEELKVTPMLAEKTSSSGVRDVAQRDLDMAGFRIVNVGEPKEEGEFTTVDLDSVPKRSGGKGSPGKSLLAAAADHVHPAGEGGTAEAVNTIRETDDTFQTVRGTEEQLVAEFMLELPLLESKEFLFGASALVSTEKGTAHFAVRFGGHPGSVDGKKVGEFETSKEGWELKGVGGGPLTTPKLPELLKITAWNDKRDGVAHIRFKKVSAWPETED
jgi:hypothetical protein